MSRALLMMTIGPLAPFVHEGKKFEPPKSILRELARIAEEQRAALKRGVERQLQHRLIRERVRYPNGHRNLTKAQRRALGLMKPKGGDQGTTSVAMPWLK